jgi:hypothetical protein
MDSIGQWFCFMNVTNVKTYASQCGAPSLEIPFHQNSANPPHPHKVLDNLIIHNYICDSSQNEEVCDLFYISWYLMAAATIPAA